MRHGRPMHPDNDVRMSHGNDGRARRRGIVPVTTSIESSIAGLKECTFESRVVGEGTMRVVAAVVPYAPCLARDLLHQSEQYCAFIGRGHLSTSEAHSSSLLLGFEASKKKGKPVLFYQAPYSSLQRGGPRAVP